MKLFYECIGKGYPLVLVHGNGEDHHIFDSLVELLKENYQCILIDSRNHGKSPQSKELSYQLMCDDVKETIDSLNIKEYDYIGFSDGAIIGLLLALKDKSMKHMICIGANSSYKQLKPLYYWTFFMQSFLLIPFCLYNKKARKQRQLLNLMLKEPNISYEELKNINIPVLLLAGEHDMILKQDTISMGDSIIYGIVKIIKDGNHFLLRDYFKQTAKEILLFLTACHKEDV